MSELSSEPKVVKSPHSSFICCCCLEGGGFKGRAMFEGGGGSTMFPVITSVCVMVMATDQL